MDEAQIRARTHFAALAGRPGDAIPLADGALLIAAEEYPGLDIHAYLARIDAMADDIREQVDNAPNARRAGELLARFLHEAEGFRGNADQYYDPRNSFLNEVLDRRLGIPITLSIVYLEVARRLGLVVQGIGLPGHFLVRLVEAGTYVDPFNGRVDMDEDACAARVHELYGNQLTFERSMLAAQSNREILGRVLRNLLEIYRSAGDTARAVGAMDRMVLLQPESPRLRRERAVMLARAGDYQRARRDLQALRGMQVGNRRSERFRTWRRFVEEMAARMN
jgi:regulator of sirC expression with transglutaminase-like and TPR domain